MKKTNPMERPYNTKRFERKLMNVFCRRFEGRKLSRWGKKMLWGKRLNKNQIRKLIARVTLIEQHEFPYSPIIMPYEFCPRCGCKESRRVERIAEYPEVWVQYFCVRCGYEVAKTDNSPYTHVLEEMVYMRDDDGGR